MRLVGSALLLVLLGASALADDAKPAEAKPVESHAKVPLRVVRMLPEAHQALLFDRSKGTYVVVEAGQTVEGLTVDTIEEDEVTLLSDGGALMVLAAPAPARHRRDPADDADAPAPKAVAPAPKADATAASSEPQPADPYAAAPSGPQPSDPYADAIEVVAAPTAIGTGKDGVRVVEAPGAPAGATPAPTAATAAAVATPAPATPAVAVVTTAPASAPMAAPATVAAPAPATAPTSRDAQEGAAIAALMTGDPAPTTTAAVATTPTTTTAVTTTTPTMAPTPAATTPAATTPAATTPAATTPTAGPTVLARGDVNAALNNFGALSSAIRGGFTADGLHIDSVAAGSLFAKAGLRAGDIVASVDGRPLHSLDDAAELYARAGGVKAMSASVLRAGKPLTLRVSIQ